MRKKIREDEWAQPILVSLLAIHHKKKKITTIDGDAGRIRHPRKKERKKKQYDTFFFNLLLWDNRTLGYHPFRAKGKGKQQRYYDTRLFYGQIKI